MLCLAAALFLAATHADEARSLGEVHARRAVAIIERECSLAGGAPCANAIDVDDDGAADVCADAVAAPRARCIVEGLAAWLRDLRAQLRLELHLSARLSEANARAALLSLIHISEPTRPY